MKVGLVRRGYAATGGAEAYLLRLAGELARRGHELVLFSDVAWPKEILAAHGLTPVILEASGPRDFANGLENVRPHHGLDLLFSLERVWSCDLYRAGDGVHAAWMIRRARFEPAWRTFFRGFKSKHRQMIELEAALFTFGAVRIIANSHMVKREIVENYGTLEEKIVVIPNGLPAQAVAPNARSAVRAELGLADSDYVALFVGSGWERKGLRFAVEAARRNAGITLLVAGRGKMRGWRADERVRLLGPRGDVPRLLAAADVFILPTLYDPFSNACLEALAAGLPVITTAANGFAEIIEPGVEGEVVAQADEVFALAAALERWREAARRAEMRPRLAALGAGYSIERNVRETLAVIEGRAGKTEPRTDTDRHGK